MVLIPVGKKRKKKETYSSGEKMLLNDLNEALEWHFWFFAAGRKPLPIRLEFVSIDF